MLRELSNAGVYLEIMLGASVLCRGRAEILTNSQCFYPLSVKIMNSHRFSTNYYNPLVT